MASTHIDAPGAYPETPASEEPMQQQTQPSSRNYARETPRNIGGDAHSSGHYFNDSGINVDDATLRGETTQPGASGRNYTTAETSRSGPTDPHSSGHHFKDSGIYADDSTLSGQTSKPTSKPSSKPGVMTGAFSRVGAKDSAPTSSNNNNYAYGSNNNNNLSTGLSTRDAGLRPSDALDTPTNIIPPANTPLGDVSNTTNDNNTYSGINSTTNSREYTPEDHNKVQSGLRGKSSSNHTEPYWGSIPFGAGVYNGVTGHGSDEPHPHHNDATAAGYGTVPATHEKTLSDSSHSIPSNAGVYNGVTGHGSNAAPTQDRSLDEHNAPVGTGVYNGVVGHGSNESTSPRTSRFGEDLGTDDSTRHQRAFPLGSSADSRTGAQSNDVDDNKKDSHYKEALAGAGAAWAGSHAANEHSKRDRKHEPKATEKSTTEPRHHLHKASDPVVTRSENDQTFREQQPYPTENKAKKADDSNLGYYGAAAAAAGAGAYGMHKYSNRDSARDEPLDRNQGLETQQPRDTYNQSEVRDSDRQHHGAAVPLAHGSKSNEMAEPQRSLSSYDNDNLTSDPVRNSHGTAPLTRQADRHPGRETSQPGEHDSNLGKYGAAAAAAGAGAYGMHEYANRDRDQKRTAAPNTNEGFGVPSTSHAASNTQSYEQPQYNRLSDGTYSGIAVNDDPSHKSQNLQGTRGLESSRDQSQYNKLSDGTYSGIANAGPYDDELSRQPQAGTQPSVHDRSQYSNTNEDDSSNLGKYGAAAAVAGAGAYGAHEYANRDRDQPKTKYNQLSDGTDSGMPRDYTQQQQQPNTMTTTLPIRTQKSQATAATPSQQQPQSQYNKLSDGTNSGIATQQPRVNTTTREEPENDDSNLGKYGAGAYGAHKYANRDGDEQDQSKYNNNKLSDGTADSGIARQEQRHEPFASTIPNNNNSIAEEDTKRRGVVAPINTDMPHSSNATAAHSKAHDGTAAGRSSTDSSHGGQYNVLSSGTPSGINLENVEHVRFHRD